MDSRSRRLPFCLSTSSSAYASRSSVSPSSLTSSRLYNRDRVPSSDCFPRASSAYKPDLAHQNYCHMSSSRDYSSSDSRPTRWKLPSSLTPSARTYERPWTESSVNSRSKLGESEGMLGLSSGLKANADGDSKRAKLSYSNRGLYSSMATASATGSAFASNSLNSDTGASEKKSEDLLASPCWSSCRLRSQSSSSSSKPQMSRREHEPKHDASLPRLGERRVRTAGLASASYQPDRVTSTYVHGARPKEPTYSYSPSSTTRESSFSHHLPSSVSQRPSLVCDLNNRSARFSNRSSSIHSLEQQTGKFESISNSSCASTQTSWSTPPLARREAVLVPRIVPEAEEGRRSTRRILSRLFSRRSSQDSSSGSSSTRSFDSSDDAPSTNGEAADGKDRTRMRSVEPDIRCLDTTFSRNLRVDLSPIQENHNDPHRGNLARSRMGPWRESVVSSTSSPSGAGSNSSWLTTSFRTRCPPLFSRNRRQGRDESAYLAAELEDDFCHPQSLLRRWDDLEHKSSGEDDEAEEEQGAVGVEVSGAACASGALDESLPDLQNVRSLFSPRPRVALYQDLLVPMDPVDGAESHLDGQKDKTASCRDPEKLRKIKESLLLEDSDEEGDLCRICQMGEESASNPLIEPCNCTGSLQYVHQECIKKWLHSKISSGTNLEGITTCELCKEKLHLNIDNFDIRELYRTHVQSEYDDFISSGLYLVVLLHFCEQRFADVLGAENEAGLFNLARTLHEQVENLESIPRDERDEDDEDDDVHDNRPSIEFSDLDDDLEDEY
ncbi:LOW QUALITY PROTEIN: E3 ubiquitin-protein ligase MARCH7 [Thalassophryne amazonica]|uniref:LOW QUALITY PROTEIN: E3 ubiquitin-protein ligase MARCH7 n=1 Tax=Thalassophryne amazonica TaxID=390379 RepID=UPI00147111A3|nr:LOW QUALITY PROTEIN: E3 ubiquitin-protein ligase MARCH7 [Thalassophryne amazonica]